MITLQSLFGWMPEKARKKLLESLGKQQDESPSPFTLALLESGRTRGTLEVGPDGQWRSVRPREGTYDPRTGRVDWDR